MLARFFRRRRIVDVRTIVPVPRLFVCAFCTSSCRDCG